MVEEAAQGPRRIGAASRLLVAAVRFYQATLGTFFGGHCRFMPTCSEYAIEALRVHGAWRGLWLTARRLLRCPPLGGGGWDPVPEKGVGRGA